MKEEQRERRDWTVILLLLLLGILLMLFAGQRAIRLLAHWTVHADMGSNLNPNLPEQVAAFSTLVQPIKAGILTPAPWNGTFLTPGAGNGSATVEALMVFNPSSTPAVTVTTSPTPAPVTSTQTTSTTSAAGGNSTPTTVWTPTAKPTHKSRYIPPTSTATPVATAVAYVPPNVDTPVPAAIKVNQPPSSGNTYATVPIGHSVVIDLGTATANQVQVTDPSSKNYNLAVFVPVAGVAPPPSGVTGPYVGLDPMKVGVSQQANGNPSYQVFNWGDGIPDSNSNVDTTKLGPPAVPSPISPVPQTENTDQKIPTAALYQDPSAPSSPQTGILINANDPPAGPPPPGNYQYVVITSPGSSTDGADVSAVEVVNVSPTP